MNRPTRSTVFLICSALLISSPGMAAQRRQRRGAQGAEMVISERSLSDQDNLARAVQFMHPGRKGSLIRGDRGAPMKCTEGGMARGNSKLGTAICI